MHLKRSFAFLWKHGPAFHLGMAVMPMTLGIVSLFRELFTEPSTEATFQHGTHSIVLGLSLVAIAWLMAGVPYPFPSRDLELPKREAP